MSGSAWEGSGVVESLHDSVTALARGDLDGLDTASAGIDAVGFVANPFAALSSAGIGWLFEHLWILEEPLNALAGDPDAIRDASERWSGTVKPGLAAAEADLAAGVTRLTRSWTFEAATAYTAVAQELRQSLAALEQTCDGVSSAVERAGVMTGAVRTVVRDLVADFVGEVVAAYLASVAASWFTLGGSVAAFVSWAVFRATVLAGKIAARIGRLVDDLADLLDQVGRLSDLVRRLRLLATRFDTAAHDIGRSVGARARSSEQWVADTAGQVRSWSAAYTASAPVQLAARVDEAIASARTDPAQGPRAVLQEAGVALSAVTAGADEVLAVRESEQERARDD